MWLPYHQNNNTIGHNTPALYCNLSELILRGQHTCSTLIYLSQQWDTLHLCFTLCTALSNRACTCKASHGFEWQLGELSRGGLEGRGGGLVVGGGVETTWMRRPQDVSSAPRPLADRHTMLSAHCGVAPRPEPCVQKEPLALGKECLAKTPLLLSQSRPVGLQ